MQSSSGITFILFRYGLEVSPTVKGIGEYFSSVGSRCFIITDELKREKNFSLPYAEIVTATPWYLSEAWEEQIIGIVKKVPLNRRRLIPFLRSYFQTSRRKQFVSFLSSNLPVKTLVCCFEFHSLSAAVESGVPLENIIYFSLELDQLMREYPKEYCANLLTRCRGSVVQDDTRAADLNRFLGTSIDFALLPVSRTPVLWKERKVSEGISLIFSGYFARWSCVEESVSAFMQMHAIGDCTLTLQGHAVGTEKYLEKVQSMAASDDRITLITDFFSDDDHLQMLRRHDIGIALYQADTDIFNWDNLLFSSGKIANYAWAGLAIITNIESPITKEPPFLFMKDITPQGLGQCIKSYLADRQRYHEAAKALAHKYYDLFAYMKVVEERFISQSLDAA
ncbi:MAG: hypothetical protein M0R68_15380 [Bacteroidetes bacterium]|nr:hypothetical protein [Bacteroidota bacterium]